MHLIGILLRESGRFRDRVQRVGHGERHLELGMKVQKQKGKDQIPWNLTTVQAGTRLISK